MSTRTLLRPGVEATPQSALLAVGDLLAIGTFVYVGEVNHGFPPPSYPGRFVGTLVPFLVGWGLVAVFAGLYTRAATVTTRRAVGLAVGGWLAAIPVAHGLRATSLFHGGFAVAFVVVSAVVGAALLAVWRGAVSRTNAAGEPAAATR